MERDRDMYGVTREQAERQLDEFLHRTLDEPQAEIKDLGVVEGHWQGRVDGSQRGIRMVFLQEHGGQIVPSHATVDFHGEVPLKRQP